MKMANLGEQEIKCSVQSCKYNSKQRACTLHDITVAQEPASVEAKSKKDTVCGSFEAEMM